MDSKLITIDEHSNYGSCIQLRQRKANRFACQTLDSCLQPQMFALNECVFHLPHLLMHFQLEMSFIGSPAIGAKLLNSNGSSNCLLKKYLTLRRPNTYAKTCPVRRSIACHSHLGWVFLPTKLHISSFFNPSFNRLFNLDDFYLNLLWS